MERPSFATSADSKAVALILGIYEVRLNSLVICHELKTSADQNRRCREPMSWMVATMLLTPRAWALC